MEKNNILSENQISKMKEDKEILEFYLDKNCTSKFTAGLIEEINENSILIQLLTPMGEYDGYMVKEPVTIYRINSKTKYCYALKELVNINKTAHNSIPQFTEDQFYNVAKYAFENKKVVSIEMNDSGRSDVIGIITNVTFDYVHINLLTEYGEPDGEGIIFLSDITQLICDSEDERKILLLHDFQKNGNQFLKE